jgi:hypothetical protein
VAQRWLLAALRHRTFYGLDELNAAIAALLIKLNDGVMRHVKQSRRALYERLDRPALKALPAHRYQYAEWKQVKVNIDYHASFEDHFYSAPYTLIHETLWCRATQHTIELIYQGKRIASHVRSFVKYAYSTIPEHRPASHRAHLEWTPSRLIEWGKSIVLLCHKLVGLLSFAQHGQRSRRWAIARANRYRSVAMESGTWRCILPAPARFVAFG